MSLEKNILMVHDLKKSIKKSISLYTKIYNIFLAIATNVPMLLKTGFVVQGHIFLIKSSIGSNTTAMFPAPEMLQGLL